MYYVYYVLTIVSIIVISVTCKHCGRCFRQGRDQSATGLEPRCYGRAWWQTDRQTPGHQVYISTPDVKGRKPKVNETKSNKSQVR